MPPLNHVAGVVNAFRVLLLTGEHRVDHNALMCMVGALAAARGWRRAHAARSTAFDWLQPGTP